MIIYNETYKPYGLGKSSNFKPIELPNTWDKKGLLFADVQKKKKIMWGLHV